MSNSKKFYLIDEGNINELHGQEVIEASNSLDGNCQQLYYCSNEEIAKLLCSSYCAGNVTAGNQNYMGQVIVCIDEDNSNWKL